MSFFSQFVPLAAEIDSGAIAAIVAALLGAGGIGGFAAYRKAGKEAEGIAATTLIAVNEELRRELKRRDVQIEEGRKELNHANERIAVLEAEVRRLGAALEPK